MEQSVQDAIEIVDSARQHKCELEGRKNQLQSAIVQVTSTASDAKQEVEQYFATMQQLLVEEMKARERSLVDQINIIEREALSPLEDCQVVVNEGIDEASAVITSGENILNHDLETESGLNEVEKFITMTHSLALDSVPEVPSAVEVPSISVVFDSEFISSVSKAIQLEGKICRQSPVQIVNLEAIPGGITVSWYNVEEDVEKEEDAQYLYKLQSYHGKLSMNDYKNKPIRERNLFRDEYIGRHLSCTVRNLFSNTVYTFRVCRCSYVESNETMKQWSPWSVYQEKMTMMPGFTWSSPKYPESFLVTDKKKVATKKISIGRVLYSEVSSYFVGYPITFKIDAEGKTRSKCDCIALCYKRDPEATGIHTKDGTLCIMADGHVWVNGVCSQTRFSKLSRGMFISFHLSVADEKSLECKKSKNPTYRAVLTLGEQEAVFDWIPARPGVSFHSQNLGIAIFFQSSGWRISII